MTRLFCARLLGTVCLVLAMFGLASLPHVYGDQKCYQSITDIPCPSVTGSLDTCQTQFNNLPPDQKKWVNPWDPNGPSGTAKPNCEKLVWSGRKSGKYGEGATTPCTTPGIETHTKCVPETDTNGNVFREVCATQYKCQWTGLSAGCQSSTTKVKDFEADKYKLTSVGCLP